MSPLVWELMLRVLLAANVFWCIANWMHGYVWMAALSGSVAAFMYVCNDWKVSPR